MNLIIKIFLVLLASLTGIMLSQATNELQQTRIHTKSIHEELTLRNRAMVQGWEKEGFGDFMYQTLIERMRPYKGPANQKWHRFFLYSPSQSSFVQLNKRIKESGVLVDFGGGYEHLGSALESMRIERRNMRWRKGRREADEVQYHLVVVLDRPVTSLEPVVLDEEMGKVFIWGHLDVDNKTPLGSFNFGKLPPKVGMNHVHNNWGRDRDAQTNLDGGRWGWLSRKINVKLSW